MRPEQLRAQMAAGRPAAISFSYRQSPGPLNPPEIDIATCKHGKTGFCRFRDAANAS